MERSTFNLVKEIRGDVFRKTLEHSVVDCDRFLFVQRREFATSGSFEELLQSLCNHLIKTEVRSSWPGTDLLEKNSSATIHFLKLDRQSVSVLVKFSHGLYDWIQPSLPEDLCLLRKDDSPWLVTISHERDSYLHMTQEERDRLIVEVPELTEYLQE